MKQKTRHKQCVKLRYYADQIKEFGYLKELLRLLNIEYSEDEEVDYINGNKFIEYILLFEYDKDKEFLLHMKNSRHAGRKKIPIYASLEHIEERLKTESKEEVAASLRISVPTLYRRLRQAKKKNEDYL